MSASFLQYDNGEYADGLLALAEEHPRFIKVRTFSEALGGETLSAGGREIYLIEITDFQAPEKNKVPIAVSLSVHGPERAGLEGGARYIEDLVRWASDEPDHELMNGTEKDSTAIPVSEALQRVHLYISNINPDGWSDGDVANGGVFVRGNANGVDLNREFPTMGWTKTSYTPLSEPESISWDRIMEDIRPQVASDLHGELNSANNAFADIMLPAGQWDPLEQAREERLARHMASNVARYFEEDGVVAGEVSGNADMKPAEYATGYDVVGYDDSGFMGDYFTQKFAALEVDVEHFLSHLVPNTTWVSGLEAAHIASVRGEIETLIVEALVSGRVKVKLRLGRVGYLLNPKVVKSKDGYGGPKPPKGVEPKSYRATPMRYYRDLSKYSTRPLRKVKPTRVAKGGLRGLDTFVISGKPFPGRTVPKKRTARALKRFVKKGGNLVLTDSALRLLPRLKVVGRKAVGKQVHNAGHIDIEDFGDPYTKHVHTTASQTYYEVGLGYSVDEDTSPHFTVARNRVGRSRRQDGRLHHR